MIKTETRPPRQEVQSKVFTKRCHSASLRNKILDLRGFDSSRILILRGGILRSIGDFPEIMNQRIVFCGLLVCGLTVFLVHASTWDAEWSSQFWHLSICERMCLSVCFSDACSGSNTCVRISYLFNHYLSCMLSFELFVFCLYRTHVHTSSFRTCLVTIRGCFRYLYVSLLRWNKYV